MAARTSEERASSSKPMSVELIVKKAQNYDYNPLIPLKYWLRTAGTLLKEVRFLLETVADAPTDICTLGRNIRARRQ